MRIVISNLEQKIAVVLAGGRSSRFGSNKAEYKINNVRMIDLIGRELELAGCEVFVNLNKTGYKLKTNHKIIYDKDSQNQNGPLYAVRDILEYFKVNYENQKQILITTCDMPYLKAEDYKRLFENLSLKNNYKIINYKTKSFQPFPGLYSVELLEAIDLNLRSMKSLFLDSDTKNIKPEDLSRFENINYLIKALK